MTQGEINDREKDHSKVSVRLGEFQVELEGTHTNVKSLMGKDLYKFIRELKQVVGEIPSAEEVEEVKEAPATEYPPPLGRPATLTDALTKLMIESDWGTTPRTLGEINTALETNAIYYKPAAIASALVHLVKKGELRRLGKRGNFKYVVG